MPKYYYYNKTDAKGNYEVHEENCKYLPCPENKIFLGTFSDCHQAIAYAKLINNKTYDGCFYCSPSCHKG